MTLLGTARLIFVIGKGGVGKTTLAAALAWRLAEAGETAALAEIGARQFSTLWEKKESGPTGVRLAPRLTAFSIDPQTAFVEYTTRRLGSARLYRTIFDNRFVHYFLDATPGVNALICLGKVWHMATHGPWDRVIVDLPATGHGLGVIQVPRVVTESVASGPIRQQGSELRASLQDPRFTRVIIVSRCEELPVTESLEIATQLTDPLRMALAGVIANGMALPPLPPAMQARIPRVQTQHGSEAAWQSVLDATQFCLRRHHMQQRQCERLQTVFGAQLRRLLTVEAAPGMARIRAVAAQMEGWTLHPPTSGRG